MLYFVAQTNQLVKYFLCEVYRSTTVYMYNEIKKIYFVNSYYFNSEVDKLRLSCHFLSFDLLLYIILFCSHKTMFNDVYITLNWENKR